MILNVLIHRLRKQSLLRLTPFPSARRRGTSISLRKKLLCNHYVFIVSSYKYICRDTIKTKGVEYSTPSCLFYGWKMGFEPTTKNHHIPHIINKLQQQPKSTFQKGYKYVHNFLLFEQRYTKIRK